MLDKNTYAGIRRRTNWDAPLPRPAGARPYHAGRPGRIPVWREITEGEWTDASQLPLPNGSRLSCGASAGGRKHSALRYKRAGAQTHASPERRPRQLQALVRQLAWTHLPTSLKYFSIAASIR